MDDGSPARYLILIAFLLLGGGYFAGAEISLASVSRIRMMSYADDGDPRAKRVLYILDHFDKALSTLLVGNNVMHIACASAATLMATKLWGSGAVTPVTLVTALVVFLLAEMIPKAFARSCSEKFALAISRSMIFFMKVLTPVSAVFTALSRLIQKPFGGAEEEEPTVTGDELKNIIDNIEDEAEIDGETSELVQSAMEFTETTVRDVLIPWDQVLTVSEKATPDQLHRVVASCRYSRLPVLAEDGTVRGLLNIRRYLKEELCRRTPVNLRRLLDPVHFIGADEPIDELLTRMSAARTHFAVVRDENGQNLGIITVEDILEELVGEIYDEEDAGGQSA